MGLTSRIKSLLPSNTPQPTKQISTFIILPLYIFPTPDAWTRLYDSLSAHPSLNFTIVVNPNSGPGDTAYPELDYITALTKLNSFPNAKLLGYVHLLSTTRPIADVKSDIDTYAGWAEYSDGSIGVSGIFFDEAPNDYSGAAWSYLREAAEYARTTLPDQSPFVIFNPGTVVDSRFFSLADNIIVFEDYATNFNAVDNLEAVPKAVRPKSSVIVHHFGGDTADLEAVVKSVEASGIPGLFVSDAEYDTWGNNWEEFVEGMASS